MEEILHRLVDGLSHYNPIVYCVSELSNSSPVWCRISQPSIVGMIKHMAIEVYSNKPIGFYFNVIYSHVHIINPSIYCCMAQEKADACWLFNPEIQVISRIA